MKNIAFFIALTIPLTPGAAMAATCLTHTTHEREGEAVTSPFGVARNLENSKGWHMGLDIVNHARSKGPIYSGSAGRVDHGRDSVNSVTVTSGDMKYQYLHMIASNRS